MRASVEHTGGLLGHCSSAVLYRLHCCGRDQPRYLCSMPQRHTRRSTCVYSSMQARCRAVCIIRAASKHRSGVLGSLAVAHEASCSWCGLRSASLLALQGKARHATSQRHIRVAVRVAFLNCVPRGIQNIALHSTAQRDEQQDEPCTMQYSKGHHPHFLTYLLLQLAS